MKSINRNLANMKVLIFFDIIMNKLCQTKTIITLLASFSIFSHSSLLSSEKIGVYDPDMARFYLDYNSNELNDEDFISFSGLNKIPVTGDWDGDGFDNIGIYDPANARFVLDMNGNNKWDGPVIDKVASFGGIDHLPVVGDWNGDGKDNIGIYRPWTAWFILDINGDFQWKAADGDVVKAFGPYNQIPLAGDWNGNGTDTIAIYRPNKAWFVMDVDGDYTYNSETDDFKRFGALNRLPIIGDWDNDGNSNIGIFNQNTSQFILDKNNNGEWDGADIDSLIDFENSGNNLPVAGRWANPEQLPTTVQSSIIFSDIEIIHSFEPAISFNENYSPLRYETGNLSSLFEFGPGLGIVKAASTTAEKYVLLQNDGQGNFESINGIFQNIDEISNLTLIDLNGDGIEEILYINDTDNNVYLKHFENNTWSDSVLIYESLPYGVIRDLQDIDGDGDIDIAFTYTDDNTATQETFWCEFISVNDLCIEKNILNLSKGAYWDDDFTVQYFKDFTNNGLADLFEVTTGQYGTLKSVTRNNLGNWNFENEVNLTVYNDFNNGFQFADINNDGYIDIYHYSIVMMAAEAENLIHLNNKNGGFIQPIRIPHGEHFPRLVADLDNDSIDDFIDYNNNSIYILKNFSFLTSKFMTIESVTLPENNTGQVFIHSRLIDFDMDGDLDILYIGNNAIGVSRNQSE